jgi:hypothetical protein
MAVRARHARRRNRHQRRVAMRALQDLLWQLGGRFRRSHRAADRIAQLLERLDLVAFGLGEHELLAFARQHQLLHRHVSAPVDRRKAPRCEPAEDDPAHRPPALDLDDLAAADLGPLAVRLVERAAFDDEARVIENDVAGAVDLGSVGGPDRNAADDDARNAESEHRGHRTPGADEARAHDQEERTEPHTRRKPGTLVEAGAADLQR